MKTLPMADLQRMEQRINQHIIYVAEGTTPDDIIHPQFWKHTAKKLNPYDLVHVIAKDGTFTALFQVIRRTDTAARVVMKDYTDLTNLDYSDLTTTLNTDYFVKFMGSDEWCVLRKGPNGNDIVLKGFPSEKEAERQKSLHVKAIAA